MREGGGERGLGRHPGQPDLSGILSNDLDPGDSSIG